MRNESEGNLPEGTVEVIEIIKNLIRALEKENIPIREAYLFGSYARGENSKYSDKDVALISEKFSGVRFLDVQKMGRTVRNIDVRIEVHPFSIRDRTESFFYQEIVNSGIKVA